MASMPLVFAAHAEWASLSRPRSQIASPGRQSHSRMSPSRVTASPHGFKPGQDLPRARDRLSPTPPGQASMRSCYRGDYSSSAVPEHMMSDQRSSMTASPKTRKQPLSAPRSPRHVSRGSTSVADHSNLAAVGSWSTQSVHNGDYHTRRGIQSDLYEDESSHKYASYDDFILFPDESLADTQERVSAYTRQSPAPLGPRISRLGTPDIAPLSTDVQFFPCLGDEAEEDRINEAWYLAGRERVASQSQCSLLGLRDVLSWCLCVADRDC
ncbi:hypothetical protein CTA2_12358 [Colletotrichum tanaceti]|uniref:Uncharacterized protein n=1 Tax=Colletotrichum tanaceti TaxID=1306861 RepID=A0A4U6XJM5_9PEZI|nr:hypothetical protein CTA2_12358 [Colletotrichum tanaceti]TKW55753.1 hypothetical protein CTA1_10636 [Colletotrichum tanaceti]